MNPTFACGASWWPAVCQRGLTGAAFLGLAVLLSGCASASRASREPWELADLLCGLSATVDRLEAEKAAGTAVARSLELSREYRVVRPAILHNVLVNVGLRQRGLCYHWADDLAASLHPLGLRTLEIHRGGARMNTRREHNCVVLTPIGDPFEQGIVLDAWRYGGSLYWGPVRSDKYPWLQDHATERRDRLEFGQKPLE